MNAPSSARSWGGCWVSAALLLEHALTIPTLTPRCCQAKMREAEERRRQEAAAEKERRAAKTTTAARPKFSFKLG